MPRPTFSPQEALAILLADRYTPASERLNTVLSDRREDFLRIARQRYRSCAADHDDAVQDALLRVLACIDQVQDPAKFYGWARSVFVGVILERIRTQGRRVAGRADGDRDPEAELRRLPDSRPTPDEEASARQRLRIVTAMIRASPVAEARFLDGLSEKEIQQRLDLSRDSVATQVSRFRRVLTRLRDALEGLGGRGAIDGILERSGLPPDVRAALVRILEALFPGGDDAAADASHMSVDRDPGEKSE